VLPWKYAPGPKGPIRCCVKVQEEMNWKRAKEREHHLVFKKKVANKSRRNRVLGFLDILGEVLLLKC